MASATTTPQFAIVRTADQPGPRHQRQQQATRPQPRDKLNSSPTSSQSSCRSQTPSAASSALAICSRASRRCMILRMCSGWFQTSGAWIS
ncbi:hypothetical protein I7I53_02776 [Histoplasma capsulatum var. duboisii H88]|uniref:Uncharacterized protein n=1 Tax=Ajellomyces capsulatus (strain H88) TaxID=544711 RepID=A0A8A1LNM5_AJEC8|nr:hypothetical protein I7I53_02776 [Histoplasma capsulatum var. duboisii H88]